MNIIFDERFVREIISKGLFDNGYINCAEIKNSVAEILILRFYSSSVYKVVELLEIANILGL